MSISAIAPTFAPATLAASPSTSASSSSSSSSTASAAAVLYSSPTQSFDPATGTVVVETRNTSTGVIESQTPGTAALQYERSQMLAADKADTQGHHSSNQ